MPIAVDSLVLNQTQVNALKAQGVKFIGRYLSKTLWKGLSVAEVAMYKQAGIDIFSIYETNPTHSTYFTFSQGQADASAALALAAAVGQPEGSAIYFTVDFDIQARDFPAVIDYLKAVVAGLNKKYGVGIYGSFALLADLQKNYPVDYYYQTCAWSYQSKLSYMHIYQAQTNTTLGGVPVDIDELYHNNEIGSWNEAVKVVTPPVAAPTPPTAPQGLKAEPPKVKVVVPTPPPLPKPAPAPDPVLPLKPSEEVIQADQVLDTEINIVVHGVTGQSKAEIEDYIAKKKWWDKETVNADGSIDIEVGIFIANSPSYYHFIDYVTTLGLSHSIKQP